MKKRFHQELVKGLTGHPHVLLCLFAQPREYWESKYQGYCDSIAEDLPDDVVVSYELAFPAEFAAQCERADVLYFVGGDDVLVQHWMKQFDLAKLFDGKVIATNSASSDMLATSFWPYDWRHCMDGLGVLPIKFIPHYGAGSNDVSPVDWEKAYADLAAYGDTSLPIHALTEGDYLVIEQ